MLAAPPPAAVVTGIGLREESTNKNEPSRGALTHDNPLLTNEKNQLGVPRTGHSVYDTQSSCKIELRI